MCLQDGVSLARMSNEQRERKALQELLLSGPYSRSQQFLSETLARLHPELTIPMFSGTVTIPMFSGTIPIFSGWYTTPMSITTRGTGLRTYQNHPRTTAGTPTFQQKNIFMKNSKTRTQSTESNKTHIVGRES